MKLCLTIGVSKATPLSFLPGAIIAAKEIGEWAKQSGFTTEVVTDEQDYPVTIARLRETLLRMLPTNDEIELFILHFAGHGFRTGAEQNVWLPTDWHQEMRGISVEGLKKQLYKHGIKSLTIFSDACRTLPTDIDTASILGDPVLPRGPYEDEAPIIARFNAVIDGRQAYMLKGDGKAPDRCVFSTVLYEGLSGLHNEAFDKYLPDCVIPESLALFSKSRLKEIAETYDLNCVPEYATGIPRDHAIYFRRGLEAGNLAKPIWPEPKRSVESNKNFPASGDQTGTADSALFHGFEFIDGTTFIEDNEDIPQTPTNSRIEKNQKVVKRTVARALSLNKTGEIELYDLIVTGKPPKRIWSTSKISELRSVPNSTGYRVEFGNSKSVQLLIELHDGNFSSAVVYRRLVTVLSQEVDGTFNWNCYDKWFNLKRQMEGAINIVSDFQLGNLSANQVDNIAAKLREFKHIDPTLGAISSYLYDYTGDIDSIRRMAYFYCMDGQAIPFDMVLMGLLRTWTSDDGILMAEVLPVGGRSSSRENDKLPKWVTRPTDHATGDVAGLWPWLRQGWQFVEDPMPEEKNAVAQLRDVAKYLLPLQFSSFTTKGGQILIEKFYLENNL